MIRNRNKWLSILLIVVLVSGLIPIPTAKAYTQNQIQLSYSFGELQLEKSENGMAVSLDGLTSFHDAGMPDIPSKTIHILLPKGTTVKSIQVTSGKEAVYKNIKVKPAASFGAIGDTVFKDKTVYNTEVYNTGTLYPSSQHSQGQISYTRGFAIFNMVLYPVSYDGKNIYYTPDMQVKIDLAENAQMSDYTPVQGDEDFLSEDLENRSAINSYFNQYHSMETSSTGTSLIGSGTVDYVIITNSTLAPAFQPLLDHKTGKGLICSLAKTEDIYGKYTGRDNAEKIRNFIKDAYQVNKIKYVLLGGDGDNKTDSSSAIVPARLLYSDDIEDTPMSQIASDAYYGCLQGDYDSNHNNIFGEPIDGDNKNDVDLTYDVYVGRAPVDDAIEADNFVRKTISYETSAKAQTALMIGEQLQGNYSCSVDLAASCQSTLSENSLTNNIRKLRDTSIKEEYVTLYYNNNAFLKEIFTSDFGLLADFSSILLKYYKPIKNYLNGKDSYVLSENDAAELKKFCATLEKKVHNSTAECADKEKIEAILTELGTYLENSANSTLTEVIERSEYYTADAKPLADDIFGGDYKDQIRYGSSENDITTKGISSSFQVSTLYDRDEENNDWDKSKVLTALNASPQLVNHLGHADTTSLMKLNIDEVKGLTNASAFFYYSQGCYPGSFDNMQVDGSYSSQDSIAEELVVSNKVSGAFAAVVNSRYGWYDRTGTKGPSQAFDRWFWDGIFTQEHTNLGRLLSYSKDQLLDQMSDEDHGTVLRFCFYEINLLGDPETELNKTVNATVVDTTIPTQVAAVVNSTGASISWIPVTNAVSYQVYRYDNTIKDFVKLGDTITPSYLVNDLIWGNNIFVVKSVNSAGIISGASAQSQINNTVISGFSITSKKKVAILSWKQVTGADGYEIYRSTKSNGKYTKIGTITKATVTSYKDKTVRKNKQYYYKVCAYKKVNEIKTLGEYTVSKKIKIK